MPIPEYKPKAHFFTDAGALNQAVSQCYGPVPGNESNEFRVTSKFTIASAAKAFSVARVLC
jgi:hypothetical protein